MKLSPTAFKRLCDQKDIRKKLVGNYTMYYFPDMNAETIYLLRIIYGRRNLDEILREMSFS